ncbi:hypothetical protein PUR71_37500 [Streptomyces sp. SP17BM10]|uniref:hypothetical protein n=1 Tax=Streptomyces sp. SP17BM10 TaxID=3002530 RepID=UPI002E797329|nr:hypothetical protein [Streptomyces sp. SP17BM10]MEE1788556.1 hypothetical protein [Streptomyces sp. SP17BM10]
MIPHWRAVTRPSPAPSEPSGPTDPPGSQDARTVTFLRLGVGLIGILLPIALPLGNWLFAELRGLSTNGYWPASMSGAYYSSTRNVFVGSLCALGVFLVCYRFDRRDDRWSTAAGACAIGVALCPTSPPNPTAFQNTVGAVHLVLATLLYTVLALFSVYSFRDPRYERKPWVARGYLAAGVVIPALLLLAAVAALTHLGADWPIRPVYLCEWLATWAFGAAWTGAAVELAAATGLSGRGTTVAPAVEPAPQ